MSSSPAPVAILVGPPGSGKSTLGRRLARRLKVDFTDTDALIEEDQQRAIKDIFATDGEPYFREVEQRVIADAVADRGGVVSLGGGAVLSEKTRALLRGHRVIHLTLGVAEGVRRSRGSKRPLLAGGDVTLRYQQLLADRAPLYREVAWKTVSTERRSSGKVVREIVDHLRSDGVDIPDEGDTK